MNYPLAGMLSLCLALNAFAAEPVPSPPSPPTSGQQLTQIVQAAVTTYTLALRELGVSRLHPIQVKLSTDAADYQTHINGYIEYPDQRARWPNGLAYLTEGTLMIKAIPPYDQGELQHRVWHEMTHALQYDLSGGGAERARPWLKEGTADLFAFLAAGKADADSVRQWKAALNRKLVELNSRLTTADLLDLEDFGWDALSLSLIHI